MQLTPTEAATPSRCSSLGVPEIFRSRVTSQGLGEGIFFWVHYYGVCLNVLSKPHALMEAAESSVGFVV